jgi:hypothetical protein
MKPNLRYFIVVNMFIGAVGVICILIGINVGGAIVRPILEATGIGLLAASAVNILDRALTLEPPPPPIQRIEIIAEKRSAIPEQIMDLKYKAKKVDIIGVSLNHFLHELTNDSRQGIITRLLKHNLQLRLFLVHPVSKYLEQRAFEDNEDISKMIERQKEAVKLCVQFYGQLLDSYNVLDKSGKLDRHLTGYLQIILLNCCPYLTICRIDEDIYWGLYTSKQSGVNLPLFKTSMKLDPTFYNDLHQHIHGFMGHEDKYPKLVNMPEIGKPTLDKKVAANALR